MLDTRQAASIAVPYDRIMLADTLFAYGQLWDLEVVRARLVDEFVRLLRSTR